MHLLTHFMLLLSMPQTYSMQYLLVSFFGAPLMIWLVKQSRAFDVLFAFVPLLIGCGVYVLM